MESGFSLELTTFFIYFAVLILLAFFATKKQKTDTEFILGNRSLNFWLTALSAHASDMSSWLFLGYPALIFAGGLFNCWAAVGLIVFMFLNWHFIAPKIRTITEQSNSLTLSAYFESRFGDKSGSIRLISALMSVLFFTFYISSGLVALGLLVESVFGLPYNAGISIGLAIVVIYVFAGGYKTIAYIDLFQGFFLLGVILFIPGLLLYKIGGISPVLEQMRAQKLSTSLFPSFSFKTFWEIVVLSIPWGLPYFGQPHILTKFMGIRQVSEMRKAKYLGISWQTLALGGATLVGIVGIYFFPNGLQDPEKLILNLIHLKYLSPLFAGLVLCAILAATTNVMAAQILVVASNLSEDFYKRLFRKDAQSSELLTVSRISVILVGMLAFLIAFFKISSIYDLVLYSWTGLGASFGPLVLLSLYTKRINRYGAFWGILIGGLSAALWDSINRYYDLGIPSLLVGFSLSFLAIEIISYATRAKTKIVS